MVKSMTGFGRGEAQDEFRKITIEMKSVNHRYLDLNIKIPKSLNPFETEIRNYLKSRIVRGKVDVYVTLETAADQEYVLKYNSKLAEMYVENIKAMADEFGLDYDLKATHLSRYPDVLEMEEAEADESGREVPDRVIFKIKRNREAGLCICITWRYGSYQWDRRTDGTTTGRSENRQYRAALQRSMG